MQRALSSGHEDADDIQEDLSREIHQEREQSWKNAQTIRKQRANTSVWDCKAAADMQKWWEN